MRWKSTLVMSGIALGSALALAGCVSPSVYASALSRQHAMLTCMDRAQRETLRNDRAPTSYIYINCMRQQGYEP
jgi:hypothetical protein